MGCRIARPRVESPRAVIARAVGPDHALLQIKVKRDELSRRRTAIAQRIQQSADRARALAGSGEKELAMHQLAKKRLLQGDVRKIDDRLTMLGSHLSRIETLMDDNEIAAVLRNSNETIRELMEQVDMAALHEAISLGSQGEVLDQEVRDALDRELQDPAVLAEYEQLGVEAASSHTLPPLSRSESRTVEKPLALA